MCCIYDLAVHWKEGFDDRLRLQALWADPWRVGWGLGRTSLALERRSAFDTLHGVSGHPYEASRLNGKAIAHNTQ